LSLVKLSHELDRSLTIGRDPEELCGRRPLAVCVGSKQAWSDTLYLGAANDLQAGACGYFD